MHWTFIGQVERGQKNLSLHSILRMAEALDLKPEVLIKNLKAPVG